MNHPDDEKIKLCCLDLTACKEVWDELAFQKDVYDPTYYSAPAVILCILGAVILIALAFTIKNMRDIYIVRRNLSIKDTLVMNIFIFVALFTLFIYSLDGPIRLFGGSYGLNPILLQITQSFTVGFYLYTLGYSSFTWLSFIYMHQGKWGDNFLTKATKAFLIGDLAWVSIVILVNLICLVTEDIHYNTALLISYLLLSIATFINGIVFSISCYVLATHLKDIYGFEAYRQKKIKVLKVVAMALPCFVLIRVINDLWSFIVPDFQTELKITSYCEQKLGGSMYLFWYNFLANVAPLSLFLYVFSTSNQVKSQALASEDEWPQYVGEEDSEDNIEQ